MKKITALLLSFLIAIAPIYQAHAIFPAIGSVVTAVVGAAVTEAGTTALVNVVAGKSPWGASDNVFGGKVKIPIKSIGDWVKKQGKSVGFWTAAMMLAGFFMEADNTVSRVPDSATITTCYASPRLNLGSGVRSFGECLMDGVAKQQQMYGSDSTDYRLNLISGPKPAAGGYAVNYHFLFFPTPTSSGNGFTIITIFQTLEEANKSKNVPDSDWDKFIGDTLSKVGYGDNPFTPKGQQYPVFPVDGQTWPTTVTPVTPPMTPNKPWPTPVPTPQPVPTPDSPTFPAVPDDAWKPFPLPDHTGVKPVDPPPVTNPGTEVKPLPDGGFVIPNPLPVVVDGPVDVNLLNIEQPLTAAQLAQRDLRIDNDSAAALGSPDVLSNDSYFDAFKPVNDMMNNLPSPPSFNFTAGMFGIPSYSSCIPYTFTIPSMGFGSMSIPSQNVTIGQHCAYYDANLRPFVAWLFQALALLTVYRIAIRSTRI
ncbi:hypothetical protein IHE26_07340 [Plesiomonas shigelloides]|uniref:hypothetical protein n=1 Tax=Plesiomonas shigelloides TaxID=703 RepID=UPI0017876875|nr:hypothetical protein [Plesiomonas shigelloides]QOH81064.1 hypothetical protein IHE26_07340 [Plesiomonas shigelloides]